MDGMWINFKNKFEQQKNKVKQKTHTDSIYMDINQVENFLFCLWIETKKLKYKNIHGEDE